MLGHSKAKDEQQAAAAEAALNAFAREIERQEDIVYGVALFFECLNLLHADDAGLVETYRKQFRNVIRNGSEAVRQAQQALEEARKDRRNLYLVQQFRFSPCQGHPDPISLQARARDLVDAYNRLFPNRPRSKEFSSEETFRLLDAASSTATV